MTRGKSLVGGRIAAALAASVVLAGCFVATQPSAKAPAGTAATAQAPTAARPFESSAELVAALTKAANAAGSAGVDGEITLPKRRRLVISGDTGVGHYTDARINLSSQDGQALVMTKDGVTYLLVDGDTHYRRVPASQAHHLTDLFTPDGQLTALRAGAGAIVVRGQAKLDGRLTTHYAATVDIRKLLAVRGAVPRDDMPDSTTWEIWVDQEHLMRKVSYTVGDMTVLFEYRTWGGGRVEAYTPPADQVSDERPTWLPDLRA